MQQALLGKYFLRSIFMKQKSISRILSIVLTLVMVLSSLPLNAVDTYALDVVDGVAQIKTVEDLKLVNSDFSKYELACDIDLGDEPWTPLPEFRGTLDGKGYVISGINITEGFDGGSFGTYYGLFGSLCGNIKNLGLIGSITINPDDTNIQAGLLAGMYSEVYGVSAKIENCYGIMSLENDEPNSNWNVGTLVGKLQSGSTSNSYGMSANGAIVGYAGFNASMPNSYYDNTLFTGAVSQPIFGEEQTGKSTAEMQSADFASLLNSNRESSHNEWLARDGDYPVLVQGAAEEKPIPVSVRVWSADGILMPVTDTVLISTEDDFDKVKGPKVINALTSAMRDTGSDPTDPNMLSISGTLKKLYNISNGKNGEWLFSVNNKIPDENPLQKSVTSGDDIVIFYGDFISGNYSWFESAPTETNAGEAFNVTLTGYGIYSAAENEDYASTPIEGMAVSVKNVAGEILENVTATTDADGTASITIPSAGTYTITASKSGVSTSHTEVLVIERSDGAQKLAQLRDMADNLATLPEFTDSKWDWQVMDMAAYGKRANLNNKDEFYAQAVQTATQATTRPSTDFERTAMALTSMGYDITKLDVGEGETLDLLSKISNFGVTNGTPSLGTPNGYMYALLAYDSGEYELPSGAYWSREKLIDYLISTQHNDGGWSLSDSKSSPSDPDMTSCAISALAPYIDQEQVKTTIDTAVKLLSDKYLSDGGYVSFGLANSNSASFVIIALASLGIDADNDSRFVLKGVSLIDHLLTFKTDDGRFGYANTTYNNMATEQGFRALISYLGYKDTSAAYNVYAFGAPVPDDSTVEITVANDPITETIPETQDTQLKTTPTADGEHKSVTLPEINVTKKSSTGDITLAITSGTKLTADTSWDGSISLPKITSPTIQGKNIAKAVKVGAGVELTFDKPVRLLIPGVSTGKVGYIDASDTLHEISNTLATDSAGSLGTSREGKIIVGSDTVIWTKHFTTFVVYTDIETPDGGGDISVTVSVTGDKAHGTMLASTPVNVPSGSYAWAAIKKALDAGGLSYKNPSGNYIASIGELAEFTNGPNSGWYYYINGVRPSIGVGERKISDGEVIALVYTDDYVEDYPDWDGDDGSGKPVSFDDISDFPWAKAQILDFAKRGIVVGTGGAKFSPGASISRGDFLAVLVTLLDIKADFTENFYDVPVGSSYYNAVGIAKQLGITTGTGSGLFEPNAPITREDMLCLAYSALSVQKLSLRDLGISDLREFSDFSDVSSYSTAAIGAFVKNSLILGDAEKLAPKNSATRAEAVVFLSRLELNITK